MGQTDRILVVDADAATLCAVSESLEGEGFDVVTAASADEAMGLVRNGEFDAALIELRLQGTNGLNLARAFKAACPEMVIVLTSAFELSEHQVSRCDCGAVGFIPKPCAPSRVAEVVRHKLDALRSPASARRLTAAAHDRAAGGRGDRAASG